VTVDFSNPDAVDSVLRQGITDALTRVLKAPGLFPVQRLLIPGVTFFDGAEVSIAFVDDAEIQDLNKTWRDKDSATDVLSWPAVNTDEPLEPFLGDIAISLETAGRQAATRAWSLEDEVSLLAVHGFLHLLGHDDDEDDDAARMRLLERFAVGKPLTLVGDDNAEA
jgi:probable rRNA maturation factor